MSQYPWYSHYAAAMLETIPDRELISVAEDALVARLQETFQGRPIDPNELRAVTYALHKLCLLQREVERLTHTAVSANRHAA